jgi:hypothetical protein
MHSSGGQVDVPVGGSSGRRPRNLAGRGAEHLAALRTDADLDAVEVP